MTMTTSALVGWGTWSTSAVRCVDTDAVDDGRRYVGRRDGSDSRDVARGVPGRPVIFCLHGIGSSSASFGPQLSGLWPGHRVVAWDAPGYGGSPDPLEPPGMAGYAVAAADVIRRIGRPVHLVGTSWGGVIALEVARTSKDLLRSVIVIGASCGSGRDRRSAAAMEARAAALAEAGPEAFAATRAPGLVSPGAPPELVESVARVMASDVRLRGYTYATQAMAATDLTDSLGAVEVPALVIWGEHDTVTGRPEGEVIARRVTGAVSVSVAGAGHLANQERPDAVNAWIASFIEIADRLSYEPTEVAGSGAVHQGGTS